MSLSDCFGKIKNYFGNAEMWGLVTFFRVSRVSHADMICQYKAQRDTVKDDGQLLLLKFYNMPYSLYRYFIECTTLHYLRMKIFGVQRTSEEYVIKILNVYSLVPQIGK